MSLAGLKPLIPPRPPDVPPSSRDLLLQALLHLPRLARSDGMLEVRLAAAEIDRLLASRAAELAPMRSVSMSPLQTPMLDQLEVKVVGRQAAEPILGHFHYLRSFREDSINVAALYEGRIVALCSVSPLDPPYLAGSLPIGAIQEVAVVSRVFAFDWAPRNVISYLLARTEQMSDAISPEVRMLLTYLNPNMGFTGASYKAANWSRLGLETGTRYGYLNGEYVTDRRILSLPASARTLVEYSRMPLLPLQVFGRFLDRDLGRIAAHLPLFVVERESPSDRKWLGYRN